MLDIPGGTDVRIRKNKMHLVPGGGYIGPGSHGCYEQKKGGPLCRHLLIL